MAHQSPQGALWTDLAGLGVQIEAMDLCTDCFWGMDAKHDPSVVFALCLPGGRGNRGKWGQQAPGMVHGTQTRGRWLGSFQANCPELKHVFEITQNEEFTKMK